MSARQVAAMCCLLFAVGIVSTVILLAALSHSGPEQRTEIMLVPLASKGSN